MSQDLERRHSWCLAARQGLAQGEVWQSMAGFLSRFGLSRRVPLWHRSTEFSFDGTRYHQQEDYFLLRVGEVQVSFAHLEPDERRFTTRYRWWSLDELAAAVDPFYPQELPELLRRWLSPTATADLTPSSEPAQCRDARARRCRGRGGASAYVSSGSGLGVTVMTDRG
jgi:hypothetical protein